MEKSIPLGTIIERKKYGFTLVELIIVISILSILAIISFVSFQKYIYYSRDSSRITYLKNIQEGLMIHETKNGLYPIPDEYVTISSGGTPFVKQGIIGKNIIQILKINSQLHDPKDNSSFLYSITSDQKKYQIGAFLEKRESFLGSIYKTYANDSYENRYFYTLGDKIGIFFDNTLSLPIKEDIDLSGEIENLKVYFGNSVNNNEVVVGSGTTVFNALLSFQNISSFPIVEIHPECGINSKIFDHTVNNFTTTDDTAYCKIGTPDSKPSLPSAGNTVNWNCISGNNENSINCSASKLMSNQESKQCSGKPLHSKYYNDSENYSIILPIEDVPPTPIYEKIPGENTCNFNCESGFSYILGECKDTSSPTGGNFSINDGSLNTTQTSIKLNITCPIDNLDSTLEMFISGDIADTSTREECTAEKNISLTPELGIKNLSISFKDSSGNEGTAITQSITLTEGIFFLGEGTASSPWLTLGGVALKNCEAYNINTTQKNNGTLRGSGTCGTGTQECLENGVYYIAPDNIQENKFPVYCDMMSDRGGWTLVIRGLGGPSGYTGYATGADLNLNHSTEFNNTFKFSDAKINMIKSKAFKVIADGKNNGQKRYFKSACDYNHVVRIPTAKTACYESYNDQDFTTGYYKANGSCSGGGQPAGVVAWGGCGNYNYRVFISNLNVKDSWATTSGSLATQCGYNAIDCNVSMWVK